MRRFFLRRRMQQLNSADTHFCILDIGIYVKVLRSGEMIGNLDKLLFVLWRRIFSRYTISIYMSHNQEHFQKIIYKLNSHQVDYRTQITDTGSSGVSLGGFSAQYEIFVKKSDIHLAEKVINH